MPHITLFFPFDGELTNEELNLYLKECLSYIKPFKVELEGFSKQENIYGNYLFLNIVQGMDEIIMVLHLNRLLILLIINDEHFNIY